jgi:SAM-dependent methyltransferase
MPAAARGGVLPLLYTAVAPTGTIIGLDSSASHVERARRLARNRGLRGAVTVMAADLRAALPVAPASCDAVWIADVLYPDTVGNSAAVVANLSRALKPGCILAIFYGNWLRPLYLPGYARLEHLICAARESAYARERPRQGSHIRSARSRGWSRRGSHPADSSSSPCSITSL